MRCLVTGGNGFLGQAVVDLLLARGHSLCSLGRSPQPELAALGVDVHQGNLADSTVVSKAVAGCEAVFHVAAKAGFWGSRESYYRPNVIGTQNVVAACREHGVQYLVYTSTPSVVFTGEPFEGADESLPYGRNFLCHYAETKSKAEQIALAAHDQIGLRVCALRPHLIWGPGDPHLLPRVIAKAGKGRLRIVGTGANKVDITYIDNAAQAHTDALSALQQGRAGGKAYFISDGEPVQLWPWINGILERLEVPKISGRINFHNAYKLGAVMEFLWKLLPLTGEPPMTRFVATELAKNHWFDISAARRDLGYKPVVNPEEGLKRFIRWWIESHN